MDRRVRRGWRTRLIYERSVDRVAAISEAVHQRLVDGRVPENRIEVIHSAVAPHRAKTPRDVLRKSLGVEDDTPCLLVAAALVKRKGIDMLLNAISTLVDAGGRPGRSGDSRGNGASRSTRGPGRSRRIPGPVDRGSGVAPTNWGQRVPSASQRPILPIP